MIYSFAVLLISLSTWAQKGPSITLNWKAEPQFGGFYAAKKYLPGLQLQEGGSGSPTLQMLLSGKTNYAIVSGDEIVISHDRGNKEILALFAVYQKNPVAIMTHSKHPAQKLEQVLTSPGTLLWQEGLPYAQYLKKKYGPIKAKTAPYTGGISLFLNDSTVSQQCFFTAEPLLAEKNNLKVKTFFVADSGYNPYTTVLAVNKKYYVANKEEVLSVLSAVRKGWSDYLKNPTETNQLMNQLNPSLDLKSFAESSMAQKKLIEHDPIGAMSSGRWSTLVDQLYDLKIIKNKIPASDLFLLTE